MEKYCVSIALVANIDTRPAYNTQHCETCSVRKQANSFEMSSAVESVDSRADMVGQTTFCEATSEAGITGFEIAKSADSFSMAKYVRPLILRSPENLCLIADTRSSITSLSNALFRVDHVLQAMNDTLFTCMLPYYTNLLKESINKGEAYL